VRYRRIVAALLLGAPLLASTATAAPAAAASGNCVAAGTAITQVGWAQAALDLDRTQALTRGAGQKVAVLATGVSKEHKQLSDRVDAGVDVTGPGTANSDCLGVGTQVAGVIAAAKLSDAAFVGVAPSARIFPVRVMSDSFNAIDPAKLAKGIDEAVKAKATVICVPFAVSADTGDLRTSVEAALDAGIPVVAAAGDNGTQGNAVPYPAAYPGVLAVAAMNQAGQVMPNSGAGDFVRLGAPGAGVITLQAGSSGLTAVDGSAVAAGAVAGAVALVLSRFPGLSPAAVATRLTASATPAAGYQADPNLAGMVNPFRALTEAPAKGSPAAIAGYQPASPDPVVRAQRSVRDRALLIAAGTLLAAVIAALLAVFAPRARRRSWRPTVAPPLPAEPEPTEATPPIPLFEDAGPAR
jgi:membrane-anchored mycosin MYCP